MQVQKVNNISNSKPAFQANLIGRATANIAGKAEKTVVDIYSVSKKDKTFLERFLNVLCGQNFPEDSKAVVPNSDIKGAVKVALKKALGMDNSYSYDRVLISVEDNKKITGIMDFGVSGDMSANGFTVWADNSKSMSRKALLLSALNSTKNRKDFAFDLPLKNMTEEGKQYFKNLGFSTDKKFDDLFIPCEKLADKVEKIETKSQIDFKQSRKEVDLNELF